MFIDLNICTVIFMPWFTANWKVLVFKKLLNCFWNIQNVADRVWGRVEQGENRNEQYIDIIVYRDIKVFQ